MQHTQYKLEQNLIIKKPVPHVGIVCSNRRRVERLLKNFFPDAVHLTEYNTAWQLDIYIGEYQQHKFFISCIPVGAAGAAFVIQQLAVAGAKYIIRYGSNDDPHLTRERMNEVIIVDKADNLYGLMQSSGAPETLWGQPLNASDVLITELKKQAAALNTNTHLAICHHVEDYGAYAFPEFAGEYSNNISNHIKKLEKNDNSRLHCRDMETAALFYRAILDNFHAATVLQNVPKYAGMHQTYDGEQGDVAILLEKKFATIILNTLLQFTNIHARK